MKEKEFFYLDHAATSPVLSSVLAEAMPLLQNNFGNPSSLHALGVNARSALQEARDVLQKMLHVKEVVWTSGGSESVHLALWGIAFAPVLYGKELLIGELEHDCVLESAFALERFGFIVKLIPYSKEGIIKFDVLEEMISSETRLVACTALHNEFGTIQPLLKIRHLLDKQSHKIIFFSDCVQALGKIDIPHCVDLIAVSGHKIGATKGIGALLFQEELPFTAFLIGGRQENGKRGGTENTFGAVAFASALKVILKRRQTYVQKMQNFQQSWKSFFNTKLPQLWVYDSPYQSPYYLSIALPRIPAEVFLHHLESRSVFVSAGSACSSRKKNKTSTFEKVGYSSELGKSVVRLSFSTSNLDDHQERLQKVFQEVVEELTFLC